jgi:sugar/nucleoside kinase (ribokinase family)
MKTQPAVLGIGHFCMDTIGAAEGFPAENTSVHIDFAGKQGGGAAAQAVVAFRRLGGEAGYAGVLGTDDTGTWLLEDLEKEGVDHSFVTREAGYSSFSFVYSNKRGASRTLFNYHDTLPAIAFTPELEDHIGGARYLHLDGTMYENALRAAEIAARRGVLVSLDGCSPQKDNRLNRELIKLTDILITNAEYPCRVMEDENRERALRRLARLGPGTIIATLGADGCAALVNDEVVYYPAYPIEPVDTTGAGDAFHGAFLRALDLNFDFEKAVRFSSAVSALVCKTLGGRKGIPNLEETLDFMAAHTFPARSASCP